MDTHSSTAEGFRQTIDEDLLQTVFDDGTVAAQVYNSLQELIKKTSTGDVDTDIDTYKSVNATTSAIITSWRKEPCLPDGSVKKWDIAYTTQAAAKYSKQESFVGEIVGCFTAPFKTTEGGLVSGDMKEEIEEAASKTWLLLNDQVAAYGASRSPTTMQDNSPAARRAKHEAFIAELSVCPDPNSKMACARTLPPSHPAYDPIFPMFTKDAPGVIGNGVSTGHGIEEDDWEKPQASKSGRKVTFESGQTKIEGSLRSFGASGVLPEAFPASGNNAVISSSPSSPVKDAGRGNHGHGKQVAWEDDELSKARELILENMQSGATVMPWIKIAEQLNECFKDKPLRNKKGEMVERGQRTGQGMRQNRKLKAYLDELLADAEEDSAGNGGDQPAACNGEDAETDQGEFEERGQIGG